MKQGVFKYIFILAFIVLLIITYIVFYNNEDETNVVQDQTSTVSTLLTDLRLGIAGFDSLNPIVSNNKNIKEISRLIFDSLISINSNYSLEYGLATEIAKQDNLTYIIKLRENVTWHDGTEFTAQDVKFTIDTIKNSFGGSVYGENLQYVTGLEIVDNYTIKISLSQEVEFFEYNLTFPILSNNYFANEDFVNTAKNNTIIGTGLYKVAEKTDNSIRLEKNENYWNEEKDSLITEINISLYNNIGEVYTAFKSGYIDIMDININNVSEYVGSLGYNTVNYDDRNVNFLAFNTISVGDKRVSDSLDNTDVRNVSDRRASADIFDTYDNIEKQRRLCQRQELFASGVCEQHDTSYIPCHWGAFFRRYIFHTAAARPYRHCGGSCII